MKKLLIAALLVTSLATSAFADDATRINYRVQQAFESQFSHVDNVEWKLRPTFAKATFVQHGQKTEAFFNLHGKLMGTSTNIAIEQLPTNAKRLFAKKYSGYTVTETISFVSDEEEAYYVSAENEKESLVLKVVNGSLSIYQRNAK